MDRRAFRLSEAEFDRDILQSPIPVVVVFEAHGCDACMALRPMMGDIVARYAGRMAMRSVDVQRNPGLSARFHVCEIPTVLLFHRARVVGRFSGLRPVCEYERALRALADVGRHSAVGPAPDCR